MRSYLTAAAFVAHTGNKNLKIRHLVTRITLNGKAIQTHVYFPPKHGREKRKAHTILAIHGMTPHGNEDPRMGAVCRAFARCGYIVVSPLFRDIAGFEISHKTVNRIMDTICAIARDGDICPRGRISIFSPSFSAGMAIIAAAFPQSADLVESICSVGAYGNADSVVRKLFIRQDFDEYGRVLIIRNFITRAPGYGKRIAGVLHEAVLDNALKREKTRFPKQLATLPKTERQKVARLLNEPDLRMQVWHRIKDRSEEVRDLLKRLSVVHHVNGLKARVALIHGADDRVIPCDESMKIYNRLVLRGIKSRLLITPLISHGDVRLSVAMLVDVLKLISAFAFFFRYEDTASGVRTGPRRHRELKRHNVIFVNKKSTKSS